MFTQIQEDTDTCITHEGKKLNVHVHNERSRLTLPWIHTIEEVPTDPLYKRMVNSASDSSNYLQGIETIKTIDDRKSKLRLHTQINEQRQ